MKTLTEIPEENTSKAKTLQLKEFSTQLEDGREIVIREMKGRDLLFLEKDCEGQGDAEKSMRLLEILVIGDDKITYEEILDLGIRDVKKLTDLVGKANGDDLDEEAPK